MQNINAQEELQSLRPLAVMVGNSPDEISVQKGLGEADIIYEIEVEFPFTRLMAVYCHITDTEVGPVRSSRFYFSRICAEWSAIFAHCGGQRLENNQVADLDQMHYAKPYWRDGKIDGWINLFANTSKLRSAAEKSKLTKGKNVVEHDLNLRRKKNIDDSQIEKISIKYHSNYIVSYCYNKKDKRYYRFINSKPHIDTVSGEQIEVSNIVLQFVPIQPIKGDEEGRIEVGLIGEGFGKVFLGGTCKMFKWIKKDKNFQTLFLDENGQEIDYNKGKTWIHILSSDSTVWFKKVDDKNV